MSKHDFQLVAAHPALDFLNTVDDWTVEEPSEYLPDFAEAMRFGELSGLVSRAESRALAAHGSESEMRRLRELRGRLERIFRASVEDRSPDVSDLDQLARDAAAAATTARLRVSSGVVTRAIDADEAGTSLLRMRLVESALALLTSERMERVKACPSCGWFFLDTTKNASRRWCSMDMCGSAAKARAYYWRNRGGNA